MSIVVGLSPRPEGQAALRAAVAEAKERGLPLHVVRVVTDSLSENPGQVKESTERSKAEHHDLDEVVAAIRAEGVDATSELAPGSEAPADAILRAAKQRGATLIVIGMRRRTAVGKMLLGSVAQDVLLGAECNVLAVKATN
jgi:nucleotide-binding universal stress UspA family protein